MKWLDSVDFEDKVCVLYAAHFLMTKFLDFYFGENSEHFKLRRPDAFNTHLHLRILIEDILLEEGLERLRQDYVCPIGSLHEINSMSWLNWQRKDHDSVSRFQSKLAELYVRSGSPPLSKLAMFASLFKNVEHLLDMCMNEADPDYKDPLASIEKEFKWLEARSGQNTRKEKRREKSKGDTSKPEGDGKEPPRPVASLSYKDKIGLLYEAHAAMIELLGCYFSGHFGGWDKKITDIHLRLRLFIEDLLSDEGLTQLKGKYVCFFETLAGLEGRAPHFGMKTGSDRWATSRSKMEGFQGQLAELHLRAGSPGLPSGGPYGAIVKGLQGLFARVRFHSGPDLYDLSDEELDKFTGGTREVIAEIQAGLLAIDLCGASLRQSKQDLSTPGISAKERDETREGDVAEQAGETVTDRDGYRCSDELQITGKCRKGRNVVLLNGSEVLLSDGLFKLLLRLAIELSKNPRGWVRAQGLIDEEIITEDVKASLNQRYSDLRLRFRGYLKEHNDKEFIENDSETGYRLSIPPECLRWGKSKLAKHKTPIIRTLAKRLPRSRKPRK